MTRLLFVCLLASIGVSAKSQCTDPSFHGYTGNDTVTISTAFQVLFSKHDFKNDCAQVFTFKGASLMVVNKAAETVFDLAFYGTLTEAEKNNLAKHMKPGNKLLLDNIRYEFNINVRPVPNVSLVLR